MPQCVKRIKTTFCTGVICQNKMEIKNYIHKYSGFRLLKLKLYDNTLFGSITYDFVDFNDKDDEIYTSVVIGQNGTRKSLLFRIIIELFKFLLDRKNNSDKINTRLRGGGGFQLIYSLNGEIITFSNLKTTESGNVKVTEDGEIKTTNSYVSINNNSASFEKIELPKSILASSAMVSDKYPFISNSDFKQYHYLGVRNTPQTSSTKFQIRRTIQFIVDSVESKTFIDSINKIVQDFLEIKHAPFVVYKTLNTTKFFKGDLTENSLDSYFSEIESKYKEKDTDPPFKLNFYNKNIKGNITLRTSVIEFNNDLFHKERLIHIPKSQSKILRFNISNQDDIQNLRKEYKNLELLRKLGMISAPEIDFVKHARISIEVEDYIEEKYHVSESSSGEFNLLTSMIGLMACIKVNSLIFIDEPEVSLHPNWQMKYIHFLRNLFSSKEYKTCHILIATHSHFLISDLPGNYSKIIGVSKDSGTLKTIDFKNELDTYGWSAEQVLLDIFHVETTRNYIVAERLGKMLDFIASDEATNEKVKEKFKELKLDRLSGLSKDDPLKFAYDTIIKEYDLD